MKRRKILLALLFAGLLSSLYGKTFRFALGEGEKYSIESITEEETWFNGSYLQSGRITGKVSVEVGSSQNGWTENLGEFYILEEIDKRGNQVFELGETTTSRFKRNSLGEMVIDKKYLSPVMRNLPVFPKRDVKPGDSWTAMGEEVHNLSRNYDIPEIRFPIKVIYKYIGPVQIDGLNLERIEMNYDINYRNRPAFTEGNFYPAWVHGRSERVMLWNPERGLPYRITENFNVIFDMQDGRNVNYKGKRTARYTIHEPLTPEETKAVEEAMTGVENTQVKRSEKGITITVHNIHFAPDSAELRPEELGRLAVMIEILDKFPDRDLLVTGHAADVGNWQEGVILSEKRAANTAAYLRKNLANPDRLIMSQGKGAAEPVADNSSPEGRVLNRRVEITILEN